MREGGRVRRTEAGTTLVELLFTIVILGIAFSTLLGGTFTAVAAADRQRKQAVAEASVRSFAEAVKGSAFYDTCSTDAYEQSYQPPAHLSRYSHAVRSCRWLPADGSPQPTDARPPAGPYAQLLTLEVSSNDLRATETVTVVKRQ